MNQLGSLLENQLGSLLENHIIDEVEGIIRVISNLDLAIPSLAC